MAFFYLGIGETVADARVELVQGLPSKLLEWQEASCLYGAFECGSPDCELPIASGLFDKLGELSRV